MTQQEAFNRAWDHHVTQGKPLGYDEVKHKCTYYREAKDGTIHRCVIGAIISEGEAKALASCPSDVQYILMHHKSPPESLGGLNGMFLLDGQWAHDSAAERGVGKDVSIREAYTTWAHEWDMDIPENAP